MPIALRVLVVEDSEDDALLVLRELQRGGYDPVWERVETEAGMRAALAKGPWDVVISDYFMPEFNGFAALDCLKASGLDLPFLIVSGNIGEDLAVDAMKAGAHDYIMKDRLKRLVPAVDRETREAAMRRERKAAQDDLASATALLDQVVSITRVMVATMDPAFDFIRVNPAYAEAHRMTAEDFRGKNYFALFPCGEDRDVFRSVIETGKPVFEYAVPLRSARNEGPEGMIVNRSLHPLPGAAGRSGGIILILFDVTREVELEANARQAQKMEALGTLVGGIAHDFNNILTAIVVSAELARADEQGPAGADRYLSLVLDAAGRGKELVKQVLAFSRKKEREAKPVKLADVVREALKFLRASLPATIDIRAEIGAEDAVTLADPTEIHEVLMNLATNAAHAMGDGGGTLTVGLAAVDVDEDAAGRCPGLKPGPFIRLTVEDTGCGIPPGILSRIFDPFFTTKPQGEGTGMGLAVVHGIVSGSGGAISVASQVGKGTMFRVYFPRFLEASPKPVEASPKPIPTGHERVLLVDDEPGQASSLRDVLEKLGYSASFETDPLRALEDFRAHPESFDLVVTDQTMPQLVGTKLAEALLRIRPGIPIILCTGFSDDVSEETAASLGIREFVLKPYTIGEMASAIRRALS